MVEIPNPDTRLPIPNIERTVFLKTVVTNPMIEVGDYSYYDDPDDPDGFEKNVLYHFNFVGDRLIIGRFCQIASGATFIMNGANHRTDGFSTYPFPVFGGGWANRFGGELDFPNHGNTVIGNDVWIGYQALFMPGVKVGDGAIIAAKAVVTEEVPPYTVVAGNPAKPIRKRFDDVTIKELLSIAWWDWDIETITRAIPAISQADIAALKQAAKS